MECESTELIRMNKIKLRTTSRTRVVLKLWFKICIDIYNQTLDYMATQTWAPSKLAVRDYMKEQCKNLIKEASFPNTSFEYTVWEARQAYMDTKDKSQMKKRTFSQLSMTMSIDGRTLKDGYIYKQNMTRLIGKDNKEDLEKMKIKRPITSTKVSKILYKKTSGKFYVLVPESTTQQSLYENDNCDIVAIDPGGNPFIAYYSPTSHGLIGKNCYGRLSKQLKTSDRLMSEAAKSNHLYYRKTKLLKAASKCREKVKNIVDNMHKQAINTLTKEYETIILPKYSLKRMVSKLHSNAARAMYTVSHFSFRQKMIATCIKRKNRLIICDEAYTSKTCSVCGNQHDDLGVKKVYDCVSCGSFIHRDINAARNIFMKTVTLRDGSFVNNTSC